MKTCSQCGEKFKSGSMVTCLKSECQEAEFKANQARNAPKKRKLKPKVGAKKADGTVWVEGTLDTSTKAPQIAAPRNEVEKNLWEQNELQFARLLSEITGALRPLAFSAMVNDLAVSMDLTVADVNELFVRADNLWETAKEKVR